LRAVLLGKIGPDEMGRIVGALVEAAAGGDVAAAKVLLSYTVGDPLPSDVLDRMEKLETQIREGNHESRVVTAA
jgi:hypothetical protein